MPERSAASGKLPAPEREPRVRLESRDDEAQRAEILTALGERYEITTLADGSTFVVIVDDAVFADEAVVKVASALDAINPDWEAHLCWPKVEP